MLIIKRDKSAQEFSKSKYRNSIIKAFNACDEPVTSDIVDKIYEKVSVKLKDAMRTEDLQTITEYALMELGYHKVAKFFILYRHIHYYQGYLGAKNKFIKEYLGASNAASGSKYDANANVTEKNIATLNGELFKGDVIQLNRYRLYSKIEELYGTALAKEYIRQLESHEIYKHDESSIFPYCVSITMYPFLLNGLKDLGGLSATPKNLDSFCGTFVNLIFAISAQFAGAIASGEFLMYFDYFARKEWGDNYYLNPDWKAKIRYVDGTPKYITIDKQIEQYFQQVVYSLNQPAAARNFQSTFWNISYFDKAYFEGMFREFYFPDGTQPKWESLNWLQKKFMKWFSIERTKSTQILTFPVETVAMLYGPDGYTDKDCLDFSCKMLAEGHSPFFYISDNPDSLSSCCRLRNEVTDNQFSYSLGAGGVATGSKSVMTLNLNRLIQIAVSKKLNYLDYLREQVQKIHKYQTAFNELIKDFLKSGALPVYDAGFISMNKQYLTIGINGLVESAEFLGIKATPNDTYKDYVDSILKVLNEENKKAKTRELMFNTEMVPAENLGVKFYNWDKKDGFKVPTTRNCYNSYFYASEDESLTLIDKFKLHGKDFVQYLDGGSALHMNLSEFLSEEQYHQVFEIARTYGTNYFTFNIPMTICNDCDHVDKRYLKTCPHCGSTNVDYATRIIGYLKRISNFADPRKEEAGRRYYLGQDRIS